MARLLHPFQGQGFRDAVTHRVVAALAFLPHPEQCRMSGIDEIEDPNVGLGSVASMQAAGVNPTNSH